MLSSELNQLAEMQGTWLENVSRFDRWKAFISRFFIGCILAVGFSLLVLEREEPSLVIFLIPAILFLAGVYYGFKASKVDLKRKYSYHTITLTQYERLLKSWKLLSSGCVLIIIIASLKMSSGRLSDEWWSIYPPLPLIIYGLWIQFRAKRWVKTPEAVKSYTYFGSNIESIYEKERKPILPPSIHKFMNTVDILYEWIFNSVGRMLLTLLTIAIYAGFVWLLFSGISILPTSAAIIIGAVIIAVAIKR